jgi:uncharacterized protein YoaH (UPF0181 family)
VAGRTNYRVLPASKPIERVHQCIGVIRLDHVAGGEVGRCRPAPPWYRGGSWWCHHREVCEHCARVMRHGVSMEECPEYVAGEVREMDQWLKRSRSRATSAEPSQRSA